jgi:hypothetical protein
MVSKTKFSVKNSSEIRLEFLYATIVLPLSCQFLIVLFLLAIPIHTEFIIIIACLIDRPNAYIKVHHSPSSRQQQIVCS